MGDVTWDMCWCCSISHVNQVHTLILHKDQEEWHLNSQGAVDAHNILDEVIPEVILNYCTFK